jgi:hypothetical protein
MLFRFPASSSVAGLVDNNISTFLDGLMRTMCARTFWRRTQCALRFGGSKNVLSSQDRRSGLS